MEDANIISMDASRLQDCRAIVVSAGKVCVRDPFVEGRAHADVQSLVDSARATVSAIALEWDALEPAAKADPKALKEWKRRVKEHDDALKNVLQDAADDLFALTTMNAAKMQFAERKGRSFSPTSLRGMLSRVAAEIEAAIEATKPAEPRHTYVIQAEITDGDLKALFKVFDKCGAAYRYAAAQSDEAARQIDEWFNVNG